MSTPIKPETAVPSSADSKNVIDSHKTAAAHLQEASKLHTEAAKHHEEGNTDKAHNATLKANGHSAIANEAQKEVVKQHAVKK
jgi:hypothetical protein